MKAEGGTLVEHHTGNTQFFRVTMIPLAEIGTDPKQAQNFYNRTADSGRGKGIVLPRMAEVHYTNPDRTMPI